MTKTEMREFNRLSTAIKEVMINIAYMNASKIIHDNLEDTIEEDVDTAFMAISYSFPMFESIEDTVTRRCAKSEIHEAIRTVQQWRKLDSNLDILAHLRNNITAESVLDDIINMNGSEDDEIDVLDELAELFDDETV